MRDDEYIDRLKMPKSAVEALAKAHKLIRKWDATDAAVHDSQKLEDLLDLSNTGNGVWADSAYRDRQAALNQALNSITRALQLDEQAYQQERLQIINSPYYGS
jgi:hypothetical protein